MLVASRSNQAMPVIVNVAFTIQDPGIIPRLARFIVDREQNRPRREPAILHGRRAQPSTGRQSLGQVRMGRNEQMPGLNHVRQVGQLTAGDGTRLESGVDLHLGRGHEPIVA